MMENKIDSILKLLADTYPEAKCGLNYTNPVQLLIATILSAQTTDEKVNTVTSELFHKYPVPHKLATAPVSEVENIIKPIGLFRTKAKNIIETCRILIKDHYGEVPADIEKLVLLPGVGRKTANVVLANAFSIPSFPVDTHVRRVANRLGLTKETDPQKIENDLKSLIPEYCWIDCHHRLIYHGRKMCTARKPKCNHCPLNNYCSYYLTT